MKKIVDDNLVGLRLDKALTILYEGKSRSYTNKAIEGNYVKVNDKVSKASYLLKLNDCISYEYLEEEKTDIVEEDLGLDIIYEDADVAVVNKPKGMVVHPACGNYDKTLVNGLLYELDDLATINGVVRPGIVHRIDKDTTGLLMIAKNDEASLKLTEQLKEHSCKRIYVGLVYGEIVEKKGKIDAPIARDMDDRKKMTVSKNGKRAVTHFTVLRRFKGFTLVQCQLETGRTHQIRVHFAYIGHPLVGDKVYGRRKVIGDCGQFLHAKTIGFVHPRTNEYLEFDSEIPSYMIEFMATLTELQ